MNNPSASINGRSSKIKKHSKSSTSTPRLPRIVDVSYLDDNSVASPDHGPVYLVTELWYKSALEKVTLKKLHAYFYGYKESQIGGYRQFLECLFDAHTSEAEQNSFNGSDEEDDEKDEEDERDLGPLRDLIAKCVAHNLTLLWE